MTMSKSITEKTGDTKTHFGAFFVASSLPKHPATLIAKIFGAVSEIKI